MNVGRVQGGTNAGWRRVNQPREAWNCPCGRHNPRYLVKCYDCRSERPS